MTAMDVLIANNTRHAAGFGKDDLTLPPHRLGRPDAV